MDFDAIIDAIAEFGAADQDTAWDTVPVWVITDTARRTLESARPAPAGVLGD